MDKHCIKCDSIYHAERSTSKFCSVACRVKNTRDLLDEEQQSVVSAQPQDKPGLRVEPGLKKMTQEEIEQHYTLKNYPPVKYYSLNGGGSGSYSPYPASNPRSAAYTPR